MNTQRVRWLVLALAFGMLLAACGGATSESGDDTDTTTTTVADTTTTQPSTTTTTTEAPNTTTTSVPQTPLEELGYPVSNDWVVETVVAGIDSATGGLAIDADGVFYQADFGYSGHVGDKVYKVSEDGTVEVFAQSDLMQSLTMTLLAPDGTIYQSSYNSDSVFTIDQNGNVDLLVDGIRGPAGLALLDDGTLVVEAYDANTLHKVYPDGEVEAWVTDRRFNGTNGLTMDDEGTLYVIDHKDGSIFSVTPDGTVEKLFKFPKATSHGVYLDGSLYVTSRLGYVVFRYDLDTGDVEIIAGNGEPGDQDGRGAESSFGRPNAITVGPDGHLYINHGGGASNDPVTIRRISYQP